ncbi:MAG TPA: DUF192 domain-containing protein [Patescibacteria group bacterium]|nr:DUF192 domain-containing protein [Patescibacteria group bacterium]
MKKIFPLILICCIIIFLAYIIYERTNKPTAKINGHLFFIEVAKTQTQQEIGLAKYSKIEKNFAMYFPFTYPDYYGFWMKGMRFPIDIIFIRNKRIVTIFPNVLARWDYQNYIYKPTQPVDSVLEISAGLSTKYGFKTGDNVIISY